jgi:acyl-CoA synthetase (NDP forming)
LTSPSRPLQSLLAPRAVAVVGATERPQHGSMAFRNLTGGGFTGRTYAVNPRYRTIFGHPCYPDLGSLPEVPDCAVLAVSATLVPEILRQGAEIGLRAAVIFSAGFAEAGEAGSALQRELVDIAGRHGIAICGPNCMGIVNLVDRIPMYTALVPADLPRGRIGVVSQSGSVAYLLLSAHRIACSHVVSSGNQAVTDAADYLACLVEDPETDTIALFLEAIPRPELFLAGVVRAHALGKPIVICKPGRSPRAAEAMLAHTGTLAGSFEVFSAYCRQHGLIQVDDVDDMVETLVLLSAPRRRVARPTLGAINCSGGENALLVDITETAGIEVPAFSPETTAALRTLLPGFAAARNPLDVTGAFYYDGEGYRRCLEVVARDPAVGMVLAVLDVPAERVPPEAVAFNLPIVQATAAAARQVDKPVAFLSNLSGDVHPEMRRILRDAEVPVLEGTQKALTAIRRFLDWTTWVRDLEERGGPGRLLAGRALVSAIPEGLQDAVAGARGGPIGELEAKRILARFGLPVVREEAARSAEDAMAAARRLGFPVAVKIWSPDVPHKTDVGGVALDVADAPGVAAAFEEVTREVRRRAPAARIDGVLVQEMVRGGAEAIIGMTRDPAFGPVVLVGLGGIFVEVLKGYALCCAPFDRETAERVISRVPSSSVLRGARGHEPRDVAALAECLARFSAFAAAAAPLVRQIDLNPVFVLPAGRGVVVADALFVP